VVTAFFKGGLEEQCVPVEPSFDGGAWSSCGFLVDLALIEQELLSSTINGNQLILAPWLVLTPHPISILC